MNASPEQLLVDSSLQGIIEVSFIVWSRQPEQCSSTSDGEFVVDPVNTSHSQEIEIGVLQKIGSPQVEVPHGSPFVADSPGRVDTRPELGLVIDLFFLPLLGETRGKRTKQEHDPKYPTLHVAYLETSGKNKKKTWTLQPKSFDFF